MASLEALIVGVPPGPFTVCDGESDPGLFNAFTIAPILYVLALILSEPMLGINGLRTAADDVFARHPAS